jgi:hypothetical protein
VAATVATGSPANNRFRANSMRRATTYRWGAIPKVRVNARERVDVDAPDRRGCLAEPVGLAEVRVQEVAEGRRNVGIGSGREVAPGLAEVTLELLGDMTHQRLRLERVIGMAQRGVEPMHHREQRRIIDVGFVGGATDQMGAEHIGSHVQHPLAEPGLRRGPSVVHHVRGRRVMRAEPTPRSYRSRS